MSTKKKTAIIVSAIVVVGLVLFGFVTLSNNLQAEQNKRAQVEQEYNQLKEKYDNLYSDWSKSLSKKQASFKGTADSTIDKYGSVLSKKEKNQLKSYEKQLVNAKSFATICKVEPKMNKMVKTAKADYKKAQEKAAASSSSGGSIGMSGQAFKRAGVVYANGYRYTWYSSRVLHHYRTSEWTPDSNGMYRDSNGYVVVASSTHSQGSTVPTPWGTGKVYDSGCAAGTIDIYVNFA